MILARTRKGRGVAAVENKPGWHGKPLPEPEAAIEELGGVRASARVAADARTAGIAAPLRHAGRASCRPGSWERRSRRARPTATRWPRSGGAAATSSRSTARCPTPPAPSEFAQAHPERYFEMFIAEQQLVAAAVGMQVLGMGAVRIDIRRVLLPRIRLRAHGRDLPANIRLCGSHAGVSIGEDGPSQMALEDIAAMRAVHGSTVLHPSDANQTAPLVEADGRPRRDPLSAHASRGDHGADRRRRAGPHRRQPHRA